MRASDAVSIPPQQRCPLELANGAKLQRRKFLKALIGGSMLASIGSFLYPVIRYLVPPLTADLGSDTVVAGRVGELQPNSSMIFRFGSRPGLLIRTQDGQYRALSATCTHLGCTVQYRSDQQRIWCACHNGMFDLGGRNISGPPPRPLETFEIHIQGQEILVGRKREA
jgi:cytochrome b6-f complex iron-sulfur subunit